MGEKIFNDELTKAIHRAVFEYAIREGYSHVYQLLGNIICKGDRTAENRLACGGWTFDEVEKIYKTTQDSSLLNTINNLLKGE